MIVLILRSDTHMHAHAPSLTDIHTRSLLSLTHSHIHTLACIHTHMLLAHSLTQSNPTQLAYLLSYHRGPVVRTVSGRVGGIKFSRDGTLMIAQSALKAVEVFRVRTSEELQKLRKRRKRRRVKAASAKGEATEDNDAAQGGSDGEEATAAAAADKQVEDDEDRKAGDEFQLIGIVRTSQKIRSADISMSSPTVATLLLGLQSNALEVHSIVLKSAESGATSDSSRVDIERVNSLNREGHRTGVRSVSLASDDSVLLSTGGDTVKLWNVRSGQCLRTLTRPDTASGSGKSKDSHPLNAVFLPGDHHALVGTKAGQLEVHSIASGECIQNEVAHEGAIWSLQVKCLMLVRNDVLLLSFALYFHPPLSCIIVASYVTCFHTSTLSHITLSQTSILSSL